MNKSLKNSVIPFIIFVVPTLAAFCLGFVYPFIQGLYLSFCQFTTINNANFVGITNYKYLLTDTNFHSAFWYTVQFTLATTVTINIIAFIIALILTKGMKGTNIFRTIFFMPNLIGGIVLGYIWKILIDGLLILMGQPLLALNPTAGFIGLLVLMSWQQIGYMMIIYIAGLQNVSRELIEASEIDGANGWQTLFKVKIPMVMSSITICVFLTLTYSFKLFDQNLALTNGEPNSSTELLALNIYKTFYARTGAHWRGIGQAKAVVFFVVVAVLALIQLGVTRSREVQS
ncbi:MAG: ABC transporter permease [Epulopiscium sp. Nele67-Bin002]|nr:MAG: ABC transporter permease [Epulopiscium sp. Nele67-Bin002]